MSLMGGVLRQMSSLGLRELDSFLFFVFIAVVPRMMMFFGEYVG